MRSRKPSEAALESADRRRREDQATRLLAEVPHLTTLGLVIDEGRVLAGTTRRSTHTRRIVVERAPALFVLGCGEADCKGGAHDLTEGVLAALREEKAGFEGESTCAVCSCTLHYVATAAYR